MLCMPGVQNLIWGVINPAAIWNTLKEKLDTIPSHTRRARLASWFFALLPQTNKKMTNVIAALRTSPVLLARMEQAISNHTFYSHLIGAVQLKFQQEINIHFDWECRYNSGDLIGQILEQEAILADRELSTSTSNISSTSGTALATRTARQEHDGRRRGQNTHGQQQLPEKGDYSRSLSHPNVDCYCCGQNDHYEEDCQKNKGGEEVRKRNT
jgi:hypothetical protein